MKVTEKDYDFMVECQERDIATILVEGKKHDHPSSVGYSIQFKNL